MSPSAGIQLQLVGTSTSAVPVCTPWQLSAIVIGKYFCSSTSMRSLPALPSVLPYVLDCTWYHPISYSGLSVVLYGLPG